jgi:eukaryotic-like serine/threonine-protein kinase
VKLESVESEGAPPGATARHVGRYTLYGELASGGMATVHLGRLRGPVGFSRTVAIKSLHSHYAKDPEYVAMFMDEARLAARVRHPNVVPTLDVVALQGELFLVMEYVQGETLANLVRASRSHGERIPPAIAISIVVGALLGLHAAHEATNDRGERLDIVHRDVSPQNIIVGVDGVARMLDFGVAKATEHLHETTHQGQIKGKLSYMAPEQLRGERVNRQIDIYGAAAVLWEALTCQRLFAGKSEGEIHDKVLLMTIEPPSKHAAGLPAGVDAIVMKGLARERSQRFSSAREMALALQSCGVAPATDVGEWVEARADEMLARRATWIAQIESDTPGGLTEANRVLSMVGDPAGSETPDKPSEQSVSVDVRVTPLPAGPSMEGPSTRKRRIGIGLAVAGVAVAGLAIAGLLRPHAGGTANVNGETRLTPPSGAPDFRPTPPAEDEPPSAVNEVQPADSVAPPSAATPSAQVARPRASTGARTDCNPPYTLNATGRKTYKRNCL